MMAVYGHESRLSVPYGACIVTWLCKSLHRISFLDSSQGGNGVLRGNCRIARKWLCGSEGVASADTGSQRPYPRNRPPAREREEPWATCRQLEKYYALHNPVVAAPVFLAAQKCDTVCLEDQRTGRAENMFVVCPETGRLVHKLSVPELTRKKRDKGHGKQMDQGCFVEIKWPPYFSKSATPRKHPFPAIPQVSDQRVVGKRARDRARNVQRKKGKHQLREVSARDASEEVRCRCCCGHHHRRCSRCRSWWWGWAGRRGGGSRVPQPRPAERAVAVDGGVQAR
jgi:hypothetical protein